MDIDAMKKATPEVLDLLELMEQENVSPRLAREVWELMVEEEKSAETIYSIRGNQRMIDVERNRVPRISK